MKVARAALLLGLAACAAPRGPSVVLVTLDGVRWQEVFGGADPAMRGKSDPRPIQERRAALMPFFWGTLAREGVAIGDLERGSSVLVTNDHRISYPGYHELLSGFPSASIRSNAKVPNPDPTVLEWLATRPGFRGGVAAYCSWDVFPSILNRERCGFLVDCGERPPEATLLERLAEEATPPWHGSVYDAFVFHRGMEHLRREKPRVFYLAFGDSDEWAHLGEYERYLESIRRADAWLGELWALLQSMPEYRGRCSLIVTADHGRGDSPSEWRSHNMKVRGAGQIWVGAIGPAVAPLGEFEHAEPFTQAQVAATVAALVGEDYPSAVPQAAPPLPILQR